MLQWSSWWELSQNWSLWCENKTNYGWNSEAAVFCVCRTCFFLPPLWADGLAGSRSLMYPPPQICIFRQPETLTDLCWCVGVGFQPCPLFISAHLHIYSAAIRRVSQCTGIWLCLMLSNSVMHWYYWCTSSVRSAVGKLRISMLLLTFFILKEMFRVQNFKSVCSTFICFVCFKGNC